MCDTCGCNREESFHIHTAENGHADSHPHGHFHSHRCDDGRVVLHAHTHGLRHELHEHGEKRTIDVQQSLLSANDRLAEQNRGYFRAKQIRAINVLSSPGAGKTTLLESTLAACKDRVPMAVIVGDLATENDAIRLRGHGAEVVQVTTGTLCHLDAGMVAAAVDASKLRGGEILFIENVGNLVCPASFDLGENQRVVLFSVTEGEDKPLKYPPIFKIADLVLVTKTDLVAATGFDRETALENVRRIAPQARVLEVSARTGEGIDAWLSYLEARGSTGS